MVLARTKQKNYYNFGILNTLEVVYCTLLGVYQLPIVVSKQNNLFAHYISNNNFQNAHIASDSLVLQAGDATVGV